MNQNTIQCPTFKELETELFRVLQKTFARLVVEVLEDIDEKIAVSRDKTRFVLHDKRRVSFDTAFGFIEINRRYYKDRKEGRYVYLLDQYLQFEGAKGFSPMVEEIALECAVKGPSYRHAAQTLERFLGYQVMSHEAIRQHLLQVEVQPVQEKRIPPRVLFVEVDGLYIKYQHMKKRKGSEMKIAAVHEGWSRNGKRTSLIEKRHYYHEGSGSFWEGFESFLIENYEYDTTSTLLIINGDGAGWITACQAYFRHNACYTLDRFHVARDLRRLFYAHPRYREMRKALVKYDGDKLIIELTSAVGTMETEEQEERLEKLIVHLTKHKEALKDYRWWLEEKGESTEGFRPMGSAEGTMSVFAKRLKNGRAWCGKGSEAMVRMMIGLNDQLEIKTLQASGMPIM